MENLKPKNNGQAQMGMPRSSLMDSVGSKDFVTMNVAQGVALAFTLVQVVAAAFFAPMILIGYTHAGLVGDSMPIVARLVQALNWYGQAFVILAMNALIFWMFNALAKKSWVGIAFLPSLIYTFIALFMSIALIAPLLGVV